MSSQEQRRHRRVPVRIAVRVGAGVHEELLLTEDVSFSGVFVRTDSPSPERRLVKLTLFLPDEGDELAATASVAHVLGEGGGARVIGMGLAFFALGGEPGERWSRFVRRVLALEDSEEGREQLRAWSEHPDLVEPIRRRYPRHDLQVAVRLRTVDQLLDLVTDDLSLGGAFVRGPVPLAPGAPLRVVLAGPEPGLELELPARVVRCVTQPAHDAGLGLQFEALDDELRRGLEALLAAHLPAVDPEELVPVGDPG